MSIAVSRHARRFLSLTALTTLAAACSNGTLSGPGDAKLGSNVDGIVAGPSGLEQRIVVKVGPPTPGSSYTAMLTATSTIVNTGSAPVRVTTRDCIFLAADVETTATMDRFEPLIACAAISRAFDLPAGQATGAMEVQFGVRSGPGNYTLKLRHALDPEFRGEASFRIP